MTQLREFPVPAGVYAMYSYSEAMGIATVRLGNPPDAIFVSVLATDAITGPVSGSATMAEVSEQMLVLRDDSGAEILRVGGVSVSVGSGPAAFAGGAEHPGLVYERAVLGLLQIAFPELSVRSEAMDRVPRRESYVPYDYEVRDHSGRRFLVEAKTQITAKQAERFTQAPVSAAGADGLIVIYRHRTETTAFPLALNTSDGSPVYYVDWNPSSVAQASSSLANASAVQDDLEAALRLRGILGMSTRPIWWFHVPLGARLSQRVSVTFEREGRTLSMIRRGDTLIEVSAKQIVKVGRAAGNGHFVTNPQIALADNPPLWALDVDWATGIYNVSLDEIPFSARTAPQFQHDGEPAAVFCTAVMPGTSLFAWLRSHESLQVDNLWG